MFDNVDVSSLNNALNQCKNAIDHKRVDELINDISNPSVWKSQSQSKLNDALTKLCNYRYKELEDKIDSYFSIVSYIAEYQEMEKENKRLKSQLKELYTRLYYDETYTELITQSDGTLKEEERTRRVIDSTVDHQIKISHQKIAENKIKMAELIIKIENSI
mgnify:CR=1 FL=1